MFQQQEKLPPFTSSTPSHQTAVIYPPPQHPVRACKTFCYMQEVNLSMLAAMATFGFAHKSTPQQLTSPPPTQQHAGIAMQAQLQDSGSSSSFTSKVSRSLLSTAVHDRQQQSGEKSLQAAGQMAPAQGASLMLGGPVAAAAAREGLQAPVPGPDKASQQNMCNACSRYCSDGGPLPAGTASVWWGDGGGRGTLDCKSC